MNVQLTNAGAALLNANTGPIAVTSFKLGTAFGYTPEPTDVALHGSLVYTGVPSAPLAVNANVVKYGSYLDYDLGSFAFGEIGLFVGNTLFAIATGSTELYKIALSSIGSGNSIRIDIYLSMVNANYEMWLDLAESSNQFRMAVLGTVDVLPPPQAATPNAYIISGVSAAQSGFLAYTDRSGLWNFDAYAFADQATATITGFDSKSVTIALSQYVPGMSPAYFGAAILEFSSGALFGICRNIQSAVISGGNVTLGFANSLMIQPAIGDTFVVFGRQSLSTTIPNLPIATTSTLGGVIVGSGLTVSPTGLLSLSAITFPVTSVNTKTGDVVLTATDITGFALVATSGDYRDLNNKPPASTLAVATTTTLGGVKAPTTPNIAIAGDGTIDLTFLPVKSVNGVLPNAITGDVIVAIATTAAVGLVQVGAGLSVTVGGLLTANVRTVNGNSPVAGNITLPPATTTTVGVMSVGAGLSVTAGGSVSSNILTVNGASPTAGNVVVPAATNTVAGTVKGTSVVTVAADGTLGLGATVNGAPFVAGNATVVGLVTPVAIPAAADLNTYQTAGLFFALDANVASMTNVPSTLGGTLEIEPLTVASTGGDVIQRYQTATQQFFRRYTKSLNTWSTWASVATSASLPIASPTVLGAVKVGAGLTAAGDGTLSTKIQTINGHPNGADTPFIILTPADVGAVAATLVGAPGGVASLNAAPGGSATPATDPYTFGRVPFYQNTLGTWWNAGTWNAATNAVTLTGQVDTIAGQTLLAAGKQTIDISYDNLDPNGGASPNLQTVSGEGQVYRVTVAGTTSLDGTAQWDVGDLVVAVQGVWTKITVNFTNVVFSAGTF